jgi:hypothetical protein
MTLNELIVELQDLKDSGVSGDTQVRVYADHGQCSMMCSGAGVSYIEDDSYMAESIHPDDLEDYPDAIKVVEIWG